MKTLEKMIQFDGRSTGSDGQNPESYEWIPAMMGFGKCISGFKYGVIFSIYSPES